VDSAVKEFLAKFELLDKPKPCEPHIFLSHVLSLASEPVAFGVDKLHTLDGFSLSEPSFVAISCSVTKFDFFSDDDSSVKSIQHLSILNPLVVTSPETFPANHVPDSLKLVNLLLSCTYFLNFTPFLLHNQCIG